MNTMLKELAAPPEVFHVDLAGTLQTKVDWANELHPTSPKISEKPTRSTPAARESHFQHLRGRFLLPNRTEVQQK
ncbi:MAG TPA: hypothetical protein VIS99_07660 [Terrimicrobiaceae bacterium]